MRSSGSIAIMAALTVALFMSASDAREIVAWNETRGGVNSLAEDSSYASTRAMIGTNFPGTTITGVPTITTSALSGASVVWIGSGFADTTATTPLSTNEQSALLAFVQRGGTAVLFGENDTFTSNASLANNSLFAPFGAHNTGTLSGSQAYSFPSPGAYPLSGPFGTVSSLSSSFPGWFDSLPATTSVVADLAANGEPVIAMLPTDALGPGSGRVWFFGDSGGQSAGGAQGSDWNTLYANILSEVPEPSCLSLILFGSVFLVLRRRLQVGRS